MIFKDLKKDVFTIPNILSFIRLLLVPVYVYIYLSATENVHYVIAGAIMIVSCLTDMIDGMIARKFNMHSVLGQVLDPLADKVTQFALIVCLVVRYPILWIMIGLFVVKELYQFIAMLVAAKKGKMLTGALYSGKICTTILFISLIAMIVFPNIPENYVNIIVIVNIVFLAIAFIDYILIYFRKTDKIIDIEPKNE